MDQFDALFRRADLDHDGRISVAEAIAFFQGSNLPKPVLVQVYKDLEVAFVISEEPIICKALAKSVELLQGSTALISQYYYGCLFNELLSFQLPNRHLPEGRESNTTKSKSSDEKVDFSTSAISVLTNSEFTTTQTENTIHMDTTHTFHLPTPPPVKSAIFESFARQNITQSESNATLSLKKFLKSTYNFSTNHTSEFVFAYADSPHSIFTKLVLACIQQNGTLVLPNGAYVSVARFLNAKIVQIATNPENKFKLTKSQLTDALETVSQPWVYILVNPTVLTYTNEEMKDLLSVCEKYGARVIIEFDSSEFTESNGWDLDGILMKKKRHLNVCLLGGLFYKMVGFL